MYSAHEIRVVERDGIRRSVKGLIDEDPYQVEEANYLNEQRSYHFKPNLNLPTHYTLTLRGHENFSYGGGASQGLRHGQGFQQGYNPPRFQQQQQQQQGENINEYQGQRGLSLLRSKCCSSWEITKSCQTTINKNLLS